MSTRLPNPNILPPFVVQHTIAFDPADPADPTRQFPGIALPSSLTGAVRKRQFEFLAGRHCAREALKVLAPEYADAVVERGPYGEPVWPVGILGSVTHGQGIASAALAQALHARGLGIDVEHTVPEDQATDMLKLVARPDEVRQIVRATGWPISFVFTIVFCAKEAVFKCLYPEVRRYFDFLDVEVFYVDRDAGIFGARLRVSLTPRLPAAFVLEGRFERGDASVFAAAIYHR